MKLNTTEPVHGYKGNAFETGAGPFSIGDAIISVLNDAQQGLEADDKLHAFRISTRCAVSPGEVEFSSKDQEIILKYAKRHGTTLVYGTLFSLFNPDADEPED